MLARITRFRVGSLTKMFTGVSVGQLIQAGRVDPAAPVGTYLTDYPNREVAAKVTIHKLLTHTGGTGDIFVPEYLQRREQVTGLERPNTDTLPYRGSPAGGSYSTVEDLWRFGIALHGHRLLDAHHTALVTTPRGTIGWVGRFAAYGFFQNMLSARVFTFGHSGGAPAINTCGRARGGSRW